MTDIQRPISWQIKTDTERKLADALDILEKVRADTRGHSERIATAQTSADGADTKATDAQTIADGARSDASIAITAAQTSQNIAGTKNRVFVQSSAPSATATGDMWIDTVNGNRINTWNGSAWTLYKFGTGAISDVASVLITGQIISSQITTGAIVADKIDAQAVTATKIMAGAVTADKIDANAITGKNVRTGLDGNKRLILGPDAVASGYPRLTFDLDGSGVDLNDPYLGFDQYTNNVTLNGGGSIAGGKSSWVSVGSPTSSGGNTWVLIGAVNGSNQCDLTVYPTIVDISKGLHVGGGISADSLKTVTESANPNVNIGLTGNLKLTSASSQRWKTDIEPLTAPEIDPTLILDIPVRQFRFKEDYLPAEDQRYGKLLPGLIAEEVAAAYPVAADIDEEGQPKNWSERYVVPALLAVVQQLWDRVTYLEERVGGIP